MFENALFKLPGGQGGQVEIVEDYVLGCAVGEVLDYTDGEGGVRNWEEG
jgi:hypothetical protein